MERRRPRRYIREKGAGGDAGASFAWYATNKDVISGSLSIPFGPNFLQEDPFKTMNVNLRMDFYNWENLKFSAEFKGTYDTQNGKFPYTVGVSLKIIPE